MYSGMVILKIILRFKANDFWLILIALGRIFYNSFASREARQAACLYISKVLRVFFNLRLRHGLTSLAPLAHLVVLRSFF